MHNFGDGRKTRRKPNLCLKIRQKILLFFGVGGKDRGVKRRGGNYSNCIRKSSASKILSQNIMLLKVMHWNYDKNRKMHNFRVWGGGGGVIEKSHAFSKFYRKSHALNRLVQNRIKVMRSRYLTLRDDLPTINFVVSIVKSMHWWVGRRAKKHLQS